MANSIDAMFPEYWAKEMQTVFYKTNVGVKICDMMNGETITKSGDTLHRPYRTPITIQSITIGTDMTVDNLTATDETMVIDQRWGTIFQVHEFEDIQSIYSLALSYGKDSGEALANKVDADVLAEVLNAASYIDAGDVGGTAGQGIVLSTTNVFPTFAAAKRALKKKDVSSSDLYGVISPEFEEIYTQAVANRVTAQGDRVGENGFIGKYYGIDLYVSNNITSTASLALATQPTANDTVTIAGAVFTFVGTIGTTAGNVLIGANVDATRANLTTLINASGTTTATGVALSTANQRLFDAYISAVNDNAANTMVVTGKGRGVLDVSETLTDATDTWTATLQLQRCLFGVYGNPVLVMQKKPSVEMRQEPKQLASNCINGMLYKTKTFVDNGIQMVDVRVRCDLYNA